MNTPFRYVTYLILTVAALSLFFTKTSTLAASKSENVEWLASEMNTVQEIKPGMTVERLTELFILEPGWVKVVTEEDWQELRRSPDPHGLMAKMDIHMRSYALRTCRMIKIDVKFDEAFISDWVPKPAAKIKWISAPYLGPVILQ